MAAVGINGEAFEAIEDPREQNKLLFKNLEAQGLALDDLKVSCQAMHSKLDVLITSPWRMAIPPVSWKALGGFLIVMAFILKGDVASAFKVIGALFGLGG